MSTSVPPREPGSRAQAGRGMLAVVWADLRTAGSPPRGPRPDPPRPPPGRSPSAWLDAGRGRPGGRRRHRHQEDHDLAGPRRGRCRGAAAAPSRAGPRPMIRATSRAVAWARPPPPRRRARARRRSCRAASAIAQRSHDPRAAVTVRCSRRAPHHHHQRGGSTVERPERPLPDHHRAPISPIARPIHWSPPMGSPRKNTAARPPRAGRGWRAPPTGPPRVGDPRDRTVEDHRLGERQPADGRDVHPRRSGRRIATSAPSRIARRASAAPGGDHRRPRLDQPGRGARRRTPSEHGGHAEAVGGPQSSRFESANTTQLGR